MAAGDRMQHHDACIDPVSHHVQQTVYLAGRNDKPVDKTDYFKVISMATPEEAKDPDEARDCKLAGLRRHAELRAVIGGEGRRLVAGRRLFVLQTRAEGSMDFLYNLLPHLLNGLALGLLFALVALGFMLIIGVMEVINLAHGSLFALGAYVAMVFIESRGRAQFRPAVRLLRTADRLAADHRSGLRPGRGRHRRHGARAVPAPDLRQGPALRPAAHLRRGAGAGRDDPADLGADRALRADAAATSPAASASAS